MAEFRSALEDCSLHDIGFNGRWFTWERGRFSFTNIRERLDRGVTSLQWIDLFPWFSLEHLNHSFSDHCPILVDTFGKLRLDNSRKQSSFRFEAKWCLDNSFEEIVRKIWAVQNDYLPAKLTTVGLHFQHWSHSKFHDQKRNRLQLEKRLSALLDQDPTDEILAEILEVQLGLNLEADKEEFYWSPRAHINWLKNGDRNTSFFHKVAVAHHTCNRILGLEDESGQWVSVPEELLKVAVKYFGDLFTSSASGANDRVLDLVENRISDEMNENLLKPFTKEDIWCAVKSMSPLKAPGIDGYPVLFYQWYWHIVGDDVSHFCLEVLNGRIVMEEINRTHLVLIPKVDKPKNMAQF